MDKKPQGSSYEKIIEKLVILIGITLAVALFSFIFSSLDEGKIFGPYASHKIRHSLTLGLGVGVLCLLGTDTKKHNDKEDDE